MLTILTRHVSSKQRGPVADGNLSALQSNSFTCKKGLTPEVQPRSADWQTNAFSHLCFSYSSTLTFLQCFKNVPKLYRKLHHVHLCAGQHGGAVANPITSQHGSFCMGTPASSHSPKPCTRPFSRLVSCPGCTPHLILWQPHPKTLNWMH